jgi:hypothetical protein
MKYSTLVPVCLISSLVGIMLPRLFESTSKLVLAAIAYLVVMLAVDFLFGRSTPAKGD